MALRARFLDLAIKFLIKHQHKHLIAFGYPRLAVVPSEHIGLAVAAAGLYEADEIALIKRLAASHDLSETLCLDIGANIGNHACALRSSFAGIIAFEPNPPVAALLRANLLLNGYGDVTVHQVGLAEVDAELPFSVAEAGNDGSGAFAAGGRVTLPVRNGDAFLAAHAPHLDPDNRRIGFIKCDVQGFERQVFMGLRRTLEAHRPLVMFESEGRAEGEASWDALRSAGYAHLTRIRSRGDDKGKLAREWARLRGGSHCWLEPIAAIPDGHCNLLVSTERLDV
jgi:FkbM family methyltransferase